MHHAEELILIKPSIDLKEQAIAYRKEHFDNGETIINGSELFDKIETYEEWLNAVTRNAENDTVDPNWVLTDTFFACTKEEKNIIGIIDLRYQLRGFLLDFGHCGYSVRPSQRNKGYATKMLALVCEAAKSKHLTQLQLSVEKSNFASVKTILKNGGVYSRSFEFEGNEVDVYMIAI